MNTSQFFRRWIVVALVLVAGPPWLSTVALGQTSVRPPGRQRSTPEERREVEKLLAEARQAMEDARYETADSLITRAEALQVEYSVLHLGDTPKKARRDLDARRGTKAAAKQNGPQKPSQKFSPMPEAKESATRSNVPSQGQVSPTGIEGDATALPSLEREDKATAQNGLRRPVSLTPVNEPTNEGGGIQPNENGLNKMPATQVAELRQRSDALLIDARRALATGDVRRATTLVEQAKTMNIAYGFHDDSPVKVENLIRKTVELGELDGGHPSTEAARRSRAELLMEQSEQLLRWRVYDEAERLAADAIALRATFGAYDANPQVLRDRIATERKKQQPRTVAASAATPATPPSDAENAASLMSAADPAVVKKQAIEMTKRARAALMAGQIDAAEQLARAADALKVPNSAFGPQDDRPALVILEVSKIRARSQGVVRAGGTVETGPKYPVGNSVYDPQTDKTRNVAATATDSPAGDDMEAVAPGSESLPPKQILPGAGALVLFQAGEQALRDRDTQQALDLFRRAYALRDQLDAPTTQRLQDHLQLLSKSGGPRPSSSSTLVDAATAKQQLAAKQLSNEVAKKQQSARETTESDPKKALEILDSARQLVESAGIDTDAKSILLRRIATSKDEVDKFIVSNRAQLELNDTNKGILTDVERRHQARVDIDTKLAKMVDEFNQLMDERRFAEAEVLAKRAQEIDPQNPVVKQLVWQSKFTRRNQASQDVENRKEQAFVTAMLSVDNVAVMPDDNEPYQFPTPQKWKDLTDSRGKLRNQDRRRSEREVDIENKLKTPVSLSFRDVPLNDVLHQLARLAAINLHLDPKGLAEEGISPDTLVNIDLSQEVSLRSALKLILEPLHLSYVIKDEVLKITSEQLRDNEVYPIIYDVADLVIPIPNFAPNARMGLPGAFADAHASLGVGGINGFNSTGAPQAVLASRDGAAGSAMINPGILAQMPQLNSGSRAGGAPGSMGPGGLGGGQQPDFDTLTDLITSTIAPTSWDEVGGPGSIAEFSTNLSLVISQTQEVHEQIVDLLKQLRRLQDLQVTIEVRYITLNDNFFERIGVDFQADFTQKGNATPADAPNTSLTVGLQGGGGSGGTFTPNFTSDLQIPFTQGSYQLSMPQFGTPQNIAQFGFAVLSDIEAYFLVNASQGDIRTNVLQAPKVTLFNGQQANVSDTTQTPFVISVIPVVGNFAVAQEPVIVVLNEGSFLTVQAVISNDRRFVRLTVIPFFSTIGEVTEFTFSGSSTTTNNTSSATSGNTSTGDTAANNSDDNTVTNSGVTVQLPSFSFVTVTTTVSVPDGGTVLLGGVKRLSEGRNEYGVPILSKLPYINRLFTNVGIGRQTQSLMMMVTPRIIIQEEEEERLGIAAP